MKKLLAVGKRRGPDAAFNVIFLGLGWVWPWVLGEFVGFILIIICFPIIPSIILVYRKHHVEVGVNGLELAVRVYYRIPGGVCVVAVMGSAPPAAKGS